jgi:hypothetical protein
MKNKKVKPKGKKNIISKENTNDLVIYLGIIILILGVFSISYYVGSLFRDNTSNIPIGQEYRLKNIISGSNSTFTVVYYDNDEKHTERAMIPTNYNNFSFIESNSTVAILKLDRSENGTNYWNIYMQKNNKIK